MAGYVPTLFYGKAGEDPEEWIRDFRQYYLIHLQMLEPDDNINLANLGAIKGLANNNALCNINANQFRDGALQIKNTVPADNYAIAIPLVPAHIVFNEDWSIAGEQPTDLAPNAPNANAIGNTIAPGIRIEQTTFQLQNRQLV
ncbi:10941_t:CDS:2 [Acaulospora morrowiae]|uniref:10941_t:CDS:1 n=1 Tax=Acaulospora morrowiae TaxID=94023 RepID=A0A9N8V4I5_9GLOM|nr:10941_t:CDS:2 [Acaulospora morrowiae]